MNEENKKGFGLLPLPDDDRDFSFGAVFGAVDLSGIPAEFYVSEPMGIKDQHESDLCAAFSTSAVAEDHEALELCPEYTFAKIRQLLDNVDGWGADLRTACKAGQKFGYLPKRLAPFSLETESRDFVANWENWGPENDINAAIHKQKSFFAVNKTSGLDTFDSIRNALWKNRDKQSSVVTGCAWRSSWTTAPGGVIPANNYEATGFGHAFKLFGCREIDGKPYLVAQLSNGTSIGDMGMFYFPRETVNKEFTFGAFMFTDLPIEHAQSLVKHGWSISWLWLVKMVETIKALFK
jgi:hypothetical protein